MAGEAGKVGEAFVSLRYAFDKLAADFKQAEARVQGHVKQVEGRFAQLGGAVAGAFAGLQIGNVFADTLRTAGEFETKMNRVAGVSEATTAQMKALTAQAIDLGAKTSFSAGEAADAMGNLAQAGFKVEDIMKAVPGVMDLAAAAQTDLATAADIAGTALNQFGLASDQVGRVNDVLTATASKTAANLTDIGVALKYVGPLSQSLGVSFESTAAALGILSEAGLKGEQAGTALRGVMSRLINPSKEVQGTLAAAGVTMADLDFKSGGLQGVLERLAPKLTDVSDIAHVFGTEAQVAAKYLLDNRDAAAALTGELGNVDGAAKRLGEVNMAGFEGSLKALGGAWESLQLSIANSGVLEMATKVVGAMADLVARISQADPIILKFGAAFAGIAAVIAPVVSVVGVLGIGLGALGGAPVLAGIAAVTALGAAAVAFGDKVGPALNGAMAALGPLVERWSAAFNGLLPAVQTALAGLGPSITNATTATAAALEPAVALLTGIGTRVRDAILGVVGDLPERARLIATGFRDNFAGTLGELTALAVTKLAQLPVAVAGAAGKAVLDFMASWNAGFGTADWQSGIAAAVPKVAAALASIVGAFSSAAIDAAAAFVQGIGKGFGVDLKAEIRGKIGELKGFLAQQMNELAFIIQNPFEAATLAVTKGTAAISDRAAQEAAKAATANDNAAKSAEKMAVRIEDANQRLTAIQPVVSQTAQAAADEFRELERKVTGNSYYVDMIDAIGAHTQRLQGNMVGPAGMMSEAVAARFAGMAQNVQGSMAKLSVANDAGPAARFVPKPRARPEVDTEAQRRGERIADIKLEIAELQRLNAAQGISSQEYARVAAQIEGERAARALGVTATQAERAAIAGLTIQQNELLANQERAKTLADTSAEVDQANRLTAALAVGTEAHRAMEQAIVAENVAKELGLPIGDARVQQLAADTLALQANADAQQRIQAIRDLEQEVSDLQRLSAAQAMGAAAYRATEIAIEAETEARSLGMPLMGAEYDNLLRLTAARYDLANAPDPTVTNALAGARAAMDQYVVDATSYGTIAGQALTRTLGEATTGLADIIESASGGFENMAQTAEKVMKDFLKSLQRQIIEFMAQQLIMSFIASFAGPGAGAGVAQRPGMIGGAGGMARPYAKGGVPPGRGISAYSNSVVSRPTLFPFAKGVGLMGEKGKEAILPLRRGARGELGVVAANDGAPGRPANVNIQIIDQRGAGAPPVEQKRSRGSDGREQITMIVRAEQRRNIARGDTDKQQAARYGSKPALRY